jgi:hypothetical protein
MEDIMENYKILNQMDMVLYNFLMVIFIADISINLLLMVKVFIFIKTGIYTKEIFRIIKNMEEE